MPDVYFVGCSCHMAHNAVSKGWDSFSGASASFGFIVEDLVEDLDFYITCFTKVQSVKTN